VFDRTVADGRVDGFVVLVDVGHGGIKTDFGAVVNPFVVSSYPMPCTLPAMAIHIPRQNAPWSDEATY
jgi:hypothetical protein